MLQALKQSRIKLSLILLLALVVRTLGIAARPMWYDEAFAILFSEKGIAAMLVGTLAPTGAGTADIHPLGYYSVLWTWMRIFGESPSAVRMLSILAGLGSVAVIYFLARNLFGEGTAVLAGLIAALAPFQIHYAQEVRMYAFLAFWLLLATFAYWRASQTNQWRWWFLFAICAALAQYTHNLAAFYLIALALWPLLTKNWQALKNITLAGLLALLLYLPWLIHLPAQFAKVNQAYWIEKPGLYRFFTLLLTFVTNLPLPNPWLMTGLFISMLVSATAVWQTWRAVRAKQPGVENGLWLLYLSFVPAILLFLFSQWKPVYLERALLPSGAIFCIWLAWALFDTELPRPIQGFITVLLLIGFSMGIYQHVSSTGFPYAPYKELTAYLEKSRQDGDAIIHSSKLSMLPAVYYDRGLEQTYIGDPPGSSVDTLAPATQQVLGLLAEPDVASATGNARRVWFIIFTQSIQEYKAAGQTTHPQLAWLEKYYKESDVQRWGDLRVYLFIAKP